MKHRRLFLRHPFAPVDRALEMMFIPCYMLLATVAIELMARILGRYGKCSPKSVSLSNSPLANMWPPVDVRPLHPQIDPYFVLSWTMAMKSTIQPSSSTGLSANMWPPVVRNFSCYDDILHTLEHAGNANPQEEASLINEELGFLNQDHEPISCHIKSSFVAFVFSERHLTTNAILLSVSLITLLRFSLADLALLHLSLQGPAAFFPIHGVVFDHGDFPDYGRCSQSLSPRGRVVAGGG
ncbi:hypothetical protein EDD15DRAFT_2198398 [Pisolithus albus]|nr:hypothetical protein EDD15DRAFT_2198398 [Pisolithus albus]